MDVPEMTSSEFRKKYASLTRRTRVTVLGRVIGEWIPLTPTALESSDEVTAVVRRQFGSPRPAPKPGR